MKLKSLALCSVLCALCVGPANANWQYSGTYVGDGWYEDDGSRFVISFRGGASMGFGTIKNEVGSLTTEYYVSNVDGTVITAAYYDDCGSACVGIYDYAGLGDIADLKANKDLSTFSFAAGASVGMTLPNSPQWRVEIGWDHISKSDYNATPLFEDDMRLTSGLVIENVQSGGVHSKLTSDIFSIMAFRDFFDGLRKPAGQFIPYIGFGIGYADSTTELNLADLYGDLSYSVDLQNYGELDQYGVLQFYKSETSSANVAGLLAAGFSYGITDSLFLDLGARVTYVPKIKWALSDKDDSKHRDWFSAENIFYVNLMLGIRFEF